MFFDFIGVQFENELVDNSEHLLALKEMALAIGYDAPLYTATGWTGTVKECDEGVLEWIGKDALAALPQWAGDKIFLRLLREDAPFFSLKLRYEGEALVYAALNGEEMEVYA